MGGVSFYLMFEVQAFVSTAMMFLDASSHLYKRVCPSIRPSVDPVHPSVGRKQKGEKGHLDIKTMMVVGGT